MDTPSPAAAKASPSPWTYRGKPVHRVILLWLALAAALYCALQVAWRVWLLETGTPVVGEVAVASDSCRNRHRANCFLGRAVVDPRMDTHRFKTSKVPGGRFYDKGEEVPMRVYPQERLYLAAVYTPVNWLLGPARSAMIALLLLFAALIPARRKMLWIVPVLVAAFLTLG
jgi:hypothetical protein